MDRGQPSSSTYLQDEIRDLTRERDGLKRQLAFNQEENISLKTRYEEDLTATREQRDEARKQLTEKRTEMDALQKTLELRRAELDQRSKAEVEHLEKEFVTERTAWKQEKAALQGEIEHLKTSASGIPAEEVEALLRELDRVTAKNRILESRMETIRAATGMSQGSSSTSHPGQSRQTKEESRQSQVRYIPISACYVYDCPA